MPKGRNGLTNRQIVFIEEYLQSWNATEAARIAGYKFPNVEGSRLLVNASISAIIQQRLTEKHMSANEVLARLADMGRSDISLFLDVTRPSDLADEKYKGKTHVIKKIKRRITRDQYGRELEELELEFYDARQTLVDIGRHHKLFTDKVEVTLKDELERLLKDGSITPEDILNEFADTPEVAQGLFESIGLRAVEVSETQS